MTKNIILTFNASSSILLYLVNSIIFTVPIIIISLFKLVRPRSRNLCNSILNKLIECWVFCNNKNQSIFGNICLDIQGIEDLNPNSSYVMISNHQTWTDILVLQNVFYRNIPFLRFFMKKELFWVPLIGQACWAMGFPFLKRNKTENGISSSREDFKTIETNFKQIDNFPVSIVNFVEGTRFTKKKHTRQKAIYKHLLRAKAGGLALTLNGLEGKIKQVINVTIVYPKNNKSFWSFVCGQMGKIKVRVETIDILENMIGDYINDLDYRESFQAWLNEIWDKKDKLFDYLTDEVRISN